MSGGGETGHDIGVLPYPHPLLDPESVLGSMWVKVRNSELQRIQCD
jgi:hypothetical protein